MKIMTLIMRILEEISPEALVDLVCDG